MQSFGVKLVYYDRSRKPEIEAMGAEYTSNLEDFVSRCDIVAINVRCPVISKFGCMRAEHTHGTATCGRAVRICLSHCPRLGCGCLFVKTHWSWRRTSELVLFTQNIAVLLLEYCQGTAQHIFLQPGQVPLTNKTRCGSCGSRHSLGLCVCSTISSC